ncbi:hypothetical protein PHYSODRAFT_327380 [Phytophthora sojae]|uniref:DUF6818 domain-containing protein n=1 Tax=Phytophthora sojae (strain P6497) TaxID=1094619 RepID=G4YT88_PHYSP|nr:hypothetical protein PHYSODRAFT_327380 [Phytophthora sojae]EGZ26482.1 hypothetical protein PHYSODRAFT_327380 [Phytophthora sojae]|eukprot:XP_009521770.1 hypothetical protein PHYSODRAFT_327380 [Phytophthora sojae]
MHLPLSRDEWDYVASLHNAAYVGDDRTTDSLKRKFAKLHRKRIPTDDLSIPANVLQAKRVRLEMTRRADLGDGEDAATEAAIDLVATTPTPPSGSAYVGRNATKNALTEKKDERDVRKTEKRSVVSVKKIEKRTADATKNY